MFLLLLFLLFVFLLLCLCFLFQPAGSPSLGFAPNLEIDRLQIPYEIPLLSLCKSSIWMLGGQTSHFGKQATSLRKSKQKQKTKCDTVRGYRGVVRGWLPGGPRMAAGWSADGRYLSGGVAWKAGGEEAEEDK